MLTEFIDKRIKALEDLCDELPLLVSDKPWSSYALGLLEKMQRIAASLADPSEDANFDGSMMDAFKDAWITTKNGNKVHFNENGEPDKGKPHVLELIKGAVEKSEAEEVANQQREAAKKKYPRKDNMSCEDTVSFKNHGAVTRDKLGRKVTHFDHDEDVMQVTRPVTLQDSTGQMYKLCRGEIQHLTVFASDSVGRGVDVAEKLTEQVGGSVKSWKHVKGIAVVERGGVRRQADVHWFESPESGQVLWKIKQWREDMDESQVYWQE